MGNSGKHPIIGNGQYYIEPLIRKSFGGEPVLPHEYSEAKVRLSADIEKIQASFSSSEEVFVDKKIVCVRLEPKFEAKSYTPKSLIADTDMKLVGGRRYTIEREGAAKGKLYFVRVSNSDLENLKNKLISGKKDHVKKWQNQICTIKRIDLLRPDEKVLGFDDSWTSGTVEVVIHPLGIDKNSAIEGFFNITGIQKEEATIRSYDDGLTFVCVHMDKSLIDKAKKYNPLRSLKPISDDWDDPFRMSAMVSPAPKLPQKLFKSNIKIGIFDGGIQAGTGLLEPFVTNHDMVEGKPTVKGLDHGAGVCGAALYGNLAGKTEMDEVENPVVSVESFRVFPAKKTGNAEADMQMYTTIDIIENVVREREDIKLFGLSFGPKGAILDDEINRFTYVCDKLTYDVDEGEVNPLFCVAVGNDGDLEGPFNRIQSPSDMVNGIAIGAYSLNPLNDKYHAPYSCIGPGREGAKIKPDLLEFGGTQDRPFIAVKSGNQIEGVCGTSYSAPVVVGKIGRLMAASDQIVPHLGRALLIHHAEADGMESNPENGFGFCSENVEELLNCSDNRVTIFYEGEITSSASVRLPVFMPEINAARGNAHIKWTICTVVNPNLNDTDAYTNNCIEDTFYPNEMKFSFRKKGKATKNLNLLNSEDVKTARLLISQGYTKSDLPLSKPAKKNYREEDLRNSDFKWDTVIRKDVSMKCSSLVNPFLSLHAIGRDEYEHERIKYFVVITVDVPKFKGSLYDNILNTYPNLTPISIQNVNRLMTQIK